MVVRPKALYASECLPMTRKGMLEEFEIKESPVENITDAIWKRRISFYGHVASIENSGGFKSLRRGRVC